MVILVNTLVDFRRFTRIAPFCKARSNKVIMIVFLKDGCMSYRYSPYIGDNRFKKNCPL